MDEMYLFIPEDPTADLPMEEVMPEAGMEVEQPFSEPIPNPEIQMTEMDFDPSVDNFLSSVSELKSSVI